MSIYGGGFDMGSASIIADDLTPVGDFRYPVFGVDEAGNPKRVICKGVSIKTGTGTIVVHPMHNPPLEYYTIYLDSSNPPVGFLFDYVVGTGSTANMANVQLIPVIGNVA